MKEFWQWLINIGYTEGELENLNKNHMEILKKEYTDLLQEYKVRSKTK